MQVQISLQKCLKNAAKAPWIKVRDKQDNSRFCNTAMKFSLLMPLMQVNLFWSLQSKPQFHCHSQCYRGGSNKIVHVECICAYMHETLHLSVKQSCTHMEATISSHLFFIVIFVVNRNIKTRSENYSSLKMTHGRNCS